MSKVLDKKFAAKVEKYGFCPGKISVYADSEKNAQEIVNKMIVEKKITTKDNRIQWNDFKWVSIVDFPKQFKLSIDFSKCLTMMVTFKSFNNKEKTIVGNKNKIRKVLMESGYNVAD